MIRMTLPVAGVALILALGLAACAPAAEPTASEPVSTTNPAAGMCAQDQPDCVDTPQLTDDEAVTIDETGIEQFRRDAQFYLGKPQNELNETVRVGRIGDEHMALTEDYRIGRITVELDDVDGDLVVTSATVELPDGPETFKLKR